MSLYENWIGTAYTKNGQSVKEFWAVYMPKEQKIYEDIIGGRLKEVKGTVGDLAAKYGMTPEEIVGFIDGLNDGEKNPIEMSSLTEKSKVKVPVDLRGLFKRMVEFKARHLYELPQWDGIFSEEQRKELILEQRNSKTVVKGAKVGRNEPCPCGSGKKYKNCCLNK